YSGPLSGTAKKLKVFSVASLIITIMISPIIMIVDAPMGLGARAFLLVTTLSTSAISTGLIHLCLSPYVRNIYYKPSTLTNPSTSEISSSQITPETFITIETLTLFCRSNFTTLPVKSLEPSFRFFTTWKVNKLYENELKAMTRKGKQLKPKEFFYIHNELCENKVMREPSKLFFGTLMMLVLSAKFAVAQDEKVEHVGDEGACAKKEFDESTYNLGLHIGALFIIFVTSSFGAFVPLISKKCPNLIIPGSVFFFCKNFGTGVILATAFIHMIPSAFDMLSNECLPEIWHNYPWAGAISMVAALTIFFIEYVAIKVTEKGINNKDNLPIYKNDPILETSKDDSSSIHNHGTLVLLTNETQTIGIIILEAGICLHSIIIGIALSVTTGSDFISLLIALVFHQMFEGLGLGSRIAELEYPQGIHDTYNPDSITALIIQGVLDSVSAGILLYAALVELLANDFINDPKFHKKSIAHQCSAFIIFILGAGMMSLIGPGFRTSVELSLYMKYF
ncbi:4879_t:CDS:10, partial [Funneliformis geosporum]